MSSGCLPALRADEDLTELEASFASERTDSAGLAAGSTRPLRICLVTSSYNYIKDGIALTLNRLVGYLEDQGVDVRVFAPVAPVPALKHQGRLTPVPSMALPMRPEYRLAFGLPQNLQNEIEAFNPDIIHVAVPDLLGYGALKLGRRLNVPVVASYHTRYDLYMAYYLQLKLLQKPVDAYLRYFYRACREVYVPSESMRDVLSAQGVADNVALWPRGVDVARFHPGKRSPDWRKRYGIGEQECTIVFVGRLVREKNLAMLADVFADLRARNIAYRGVIVGDGPERSSLESRIPDAVFTGFLHDEDLAQAYASSDVFFFPSETETFGNVTLEAMASGLPAVGANATGSRSLILPGRTGFIAETNRVEEFSAHLSRLVADASLRQDMGQAARQRSLEFSWDAAMASMLSYYRAVSLAPAL